MQLGIGQRGALGLGFRERHVGPGTELLRLRRRLDTNLCPHILLPIFAPNHWTESSVDPALELGRLDAHLLKVNVRVARILRHVKLLVRPASRYGSVSERRWEWRASGACRIGLLGRIHRSNDFLVMMIELRGVAREDKHMASVSIRPGCSIRDKIASHVSAEELPTIRQYFACLALACHAPV